jgi:hypothetical protein
MKYSVRSSLFSLKTIHQIFYNSLQYERVLKILYFHFLILLNFRKFTYGLSLIEQHHEVEEKKNCLN